MNKTTYDMVQNRLTSLMTEEKMKDKSLNKKEQEIYKMAVLACKSVLAKALEAEDEMSIL